MGRDSTFRTLVHEKYGEVMRWPMGLPRCLRNRKADRMNRIMQALSSGSVAERERMLTELGLRG